DAVGPDVNGEAVQVIEAAYIDAARRVTLGLVFQRGFELRRSGVPLGLVVELDPVAVRILADESGAMPEIALGPPDIEAGALQRSDAASKRLGTARAEGHVSHS